MRRHMCTTLLAGFVLLLTLCTGADAARKKRFIHETPPDLTQGGKPDDTHDWSLGPIGANGWVFNRRPQEGASRLSRQTLITRVEKDGPADGRLQLDDVVLGVDGEKFSYDARKVLAAAINEAEKEINKGQLRLLVWRKGKELDTTLTLPAMGSYSKTMPFSCPKTDRIVDQACEYMKSKPLKEGWLGYIDALGMLATGREDLLPMVKEFARSVCVSGEKLSVEKHVPMKCWHWSYKTLFLCEYYLLTRDEHVLPTITEYAAKIAMGQSGAGTWGHTYAARENTGYLHGHLGGYGAINQMGLTLMICLKLADECGVKNDEVAAAIVRGNDFFKYFVGKGTIPYGDHGAANEWYESQRRGKLQPDDPANAIREAIKKIEAIKTPPSFDLVSIADQIRNAWENRHDTSGPHRATDLRPPRHP